MLLLRRVHRVNTYRKLDVDRTMTGAQQAQYLTQLRKVLANLAAQFPLYVTPAYIDRRITEEQTKLNAPATANLIKPLEELK
jgi:hypothetical protein